MDIPWYIFGLAGMFFFVAWALTLKAVLVTEKALTVLRILAFGQGIIYLIVWLFLDLPFPQTGILLLLAAILCAASGNLLEQFAVKRSSNPGLHGAIKSGQIVLIVIVSAFVTANVSFTWQGFFLCLCAVIGIAGIGLARQEENAGGKTLPWKKYSYASLVIFATMTILWRELYETHALHPITFSVALWLGTSLLLELWALTKREPLAIQNTAKILKLSIPLIGAAAIANLLDFYAQALAPNPGYASAIKGSQIVFITLLAPLFFPDSKVSPRMWIFIILILIGVIGLSLL